MSSICFAPYKTTVMIRIREIYIGYYRPIRTNVHNNVSNGYLATDVLKRNFEAMFTCRDIYSKRRKHSGNKEILRYSCEYFWQPKIKTKPRYTQMHVYKRKNVKYFSLKNPAKRWLNHKKIIYPPKRMRSGKHLRFSCTVCALRMYGV